MHDHLATLVGQIGNWGYLAIFLFVMAECSAVFFLPGETLVVIGGFFAAHGQLGLGKLIAVVATGAILGYCIGYALGRKFGRVRLIHYGKWIGLNQKHFKRVDDFFAKYGGAAIFFGRFTSFMRAFVALAAGTSGMPYARFLFFNVVGGAAWSIAFTLLGYFVGAAWPAAEHWMARSTLILFLAIVLFGGIFWYRRQRS